MFRSGRIRVLTVGLVAIAIVATACASSSTSSSTGASLVSGAGTFTPIGTKVAGGTVTWAESPGAEPNYIFPFYNFQYCSVANASQFQPLMYRSLYWYGNGNTASVDYNYSVGNQPTFSPDGKTMTITLKPTYMWSDGEHVDARDVIFWMNMLKAEKANWCGYTPGFFPDNVVSYTATGPYTVQFVMNKAYSPTWLIYNELSQITPLPLAWDTTTSAVNTDLTSTSLPDTTSAGATAVYNNLNNLAKNPGSYATSPIWAVEDGPFKLTSFTTTGEATFVPNLKYTGPVKATIAKFVELPYTSIESEVDVAATGPSNLTVGYVPVSDLPRLSSITSLGYKSIAAYTFSFDYFPLNLNNPKFGPVFAQTYFRQALQYLIDQQGWITAFETGGPGNQAYAQPTYGPIPTHPAGNFLPASSDATTNPYPYNPSKAASLLSSHGWTVRPNGTTTCTSPGSGPTDCGAGIPAGLALSINLDYESQTPFLTSEMENLKSVAGQYAGIQLQLTEHPFDEVIGAAVPCKPTQSTCSWTIENWGGGWVYSPDYYPSGESIVGTGSAANAGSYTNPTMNSLIAATTTASAATAPSELDTYQDFVRAQVPMLFQPNTSGNPQPGGPTLVSEHLGGFSVNAYSYITPESYYLTTGS